jgi:hypothetical protein
MLVQRELCDLAVQAFRFLLASDGDACQLVYSKANRTRFKLPLRGVACRRVCVTSGRGEREREREPPLALLSLRAQAPAPAYVSPASSDSLASGHLHMHASPSLQHVWPLGTNTHKPQPPAIVWPLGTYTCTTLHESANEFGCTCCMISCCTVVKAPRCGVALVKHKHPPHPPFSRPSPISRMSQIPPLAPPSLRTQAPVPT